MGTGRFSDEILHRMTELESLIQTFGLKLEPRYYLVVSLLAVSGVELSDFRKIVDMKTRMNEMLKLHPKYDHTLFLAAQLYTQSHAGESPLKYCTGMAQICEAVADMDGGGDDAGSGSGE